MHRSYVTEIAQRDNGGNTVRGSLRAAANHLKGLRG